MAQRPGMTVAVLFSGGDTPAMNAFLRAFVRVGLNRHGASILAVKDGFRGLVRTCRRLASGEITLEGVRAELTEHPGQEGILRGHQDLVRMDHPSVSRIVGRGGTILGSSRCPEFHGEEVRREAVALLRDLGVDGLVVVGGDGSMAGAARVAAESSLRVVVVPATIDNDFAATEMALGVDTAVNTLVWAVERFNDTASSHHRVMVLETMGRGSGQLALLSALASGAEIVVIPERGTVDGEKMRGIAGRIEEAMGRGRDHAVVLIAEGVHLDPADSAGPAHALSTWLRGHFKQRGGAFADVETRASILGHLQRGGSPSAADRILAARFADAAWESAVAVERASGVVGLRDGTVSLQPFDAAADARRQEEAARSAERLYLLQKAVSKW